MYFTFLSYHADAGRGDLGTLAYLNDIGTRHIVPDIQRIVAVHAIEAEYLDARQVEHVHRRVLQTV